MTRARLEVRLADEDREKLDALVATRGKPVSTVIRDLIGAAFEADVEAHRRAAAIRLINLRGEPMPEPEVVKRQIESMYDDAFSPDLP